MTGYYDRFNFSQLLTLGWNIIKFFANVFGFLSTETINTLIREFPFFGNLVDFFPVLDVWLDTNIIANTSLIGVIFGYAVVITLVYYILGGVIKFVVS